MVVTLSPARASARASARPRAWAARASRGAAQQDHDRQACARRQQYLRFLVRAAGCVNTLRRISLVPHVRQTSGVVGSLSSTVIPQLPTTPGLPGYPCVYWYTCQPKYQSYSGRWYPAHPSLPPRGRGRAEARKPARARHGDVNVRAAARGRGDPAQCHEGEALERKFFPKQGETMRIERRAKI